MVDVDVVVVVDVVDVVVVCAAQCSARRCRQVELWAAVQQQWERGGGSAGPGTADRSAAQ